MSDHPTFQEEEEELHMAAAAVHLAQSLQRGLDSLIGFIPNLGGRELAADMMRDACHSSPDTRRRNRSGPRPGGDRVER
jgi:hypothetical protein